MENFDYQGKKRKQYQDSMKMMTYSGVGFVLMIIILALTN